MKICAKNQPMKQQSRHPAPQSPALSRRSFLAAGSGALAGLSAGPGQLLAAASASSPVVVELFTSQGCSSCPPADALLKRYLGRRDVIALSLNVDYWDYLGWRDTLGSAAFSARQKDYARSRGDRRVYTPQMVINGRSHVVGSRSGAVAAAIASERAHLTGHSIALEMRQSGGKIHLEVAGAPKGYAATEATLWVMMTNPAVTVPIKRGENTGSTITYHNAVRKILPAGMWHGKPMRVELPSAQLFTGGIKGCVALLQTGGVGPVIGAARIGTV